MSLLLTPASLEDSHNFCHYFQQLQEGFELLEQLDELPSREGLFTQVCEMLIV